LCDDIIGDKAIWINGKQSPVLKLKRGYVYYFNVQQECYKKCYENLFFLTKNPCGGPGACKLPGSFDAIGSGCIRFHVTDCTPKYFYYQSTTGRFLGGLIIVE
jgi:hypothetical protein